MQARSKMSSVGAILMRRLSENIDCATLWFRQFFFSFDGRVSRSQYLLGYLFLSLCAPLIWVVVFYSRRVIGDFSALLFILFAITFAVFGTWTSWALAAKRLHDRDKGAHWLLLFYGVPLVCHWIAGTFNGAGTDLAKAVVRFAMHHKLPTASLSPTTYVLLALSFVIAGWAFVELGLRGGIAGGNLYGEDPFER
jgi:uncharacterized membrane protein YhaH (DUF805 family)